MLGSVLLTRIARCSLLRPVRFPRLLCHHFSTDEVSKPSSSIASSVQDDRTPDSDLLTAEYVLKGKKCPGCGAHFQVRSLTSAGYVSPSRVAMDASFVCQRCFQLSHYGKLLRIPVEKEQFAGHMNRIKQTPRSALVLHVVDMADCEGSLIRNIDEIVGTQNPILFVGTKLDVIPGRSRNEYLNRIRGWFSSRVRSLSPSIHQLYEKTLPIRESFHKGRKTKENFMVNFAVLSNTTNEGVEKSLIPRIYAMKPEETSDVVVVGTTNAGKSSLMNVLRSHLTDMPKQSITVSPLPSTTLSTISWPMITGGHLIDTPGLERQDLLGARLSAEEWAQLCVRKTIVPRHFHMRSGRNLFIDRFVRLQHVEGPECVVSVMASAAVQCRSSSDLAWPESKSTEVSGSELEHMQTHELFVPGSQEIGQARCDIAIPGIGWVTVSSMKNVSVSATCRLGIVPMIRPSLTPFAAGLLQNRKIH